MSLLLVLGACFVDSGDRDLARDRDGDGFEAQEVGGADCDDGDAQVFPGAFESCLDGVDSDCDGRLCPERGETTLTDADIWLRGPGDLSHLVVDADPLIDENGDGRLDLITREVLGGSGSLIRVYFGPLDHTAATSGDQEVASPDASLQAGTAGDLDGDGRDELVLSGQTDPPQLVILWEPLDGRVFFDEIPGALTAAEDVSDGSVGGNGDVAFMNFGAVADVGDWDGDGLDDLFVGSPGYSALEEEQGAVFVLTGVARGVEGDLSDLADATLVGAQAGSIYGAQLGHTGDLDADGYRDLVVGAPGWYSHQEGPGATSVVGAAFVHTSSPGGMVSADDADAIIAGRLSNTRLADCHAVGDPSGDGKDDLGCYLGSGGGAYLVFFGPVQGALYPEDADLRLLADASDQPSNLFGTFSRGHDVDADGYDELFISAGAEGMGIDHMPDSAGAAYMFTGPVSGVLGPDHAAHRWEGNYEGGALRGLVVGDLDDDGALDLLLNPAQATVDADRRSQGAIQVLWSAF